jgi:EAL domain-containing protein (putative c-di-GMP-specific phosphodiesterase class I)
LARKLKMIEEKWLQFELFNYIFSTVLDDLPKIEEKFWNNIWVSVNVDPNTISRTDFSDKVLSLLEKNNVNNENITLEILESKLDKRNIATYLMNLKKIKNEWIKISQDDFWADYSKNNRFNMLYKHELIDYLKFDWNFFKYIVEANWDITYKWFLESLNDMDIKLIFEHIESKRMLDKTLKMFPDYDKYLLQWNYLSEKKSLKELLKMDKKIII